MELDHESRHRYPLISEDDRQWGLYVTCGGFVKVPPGAAYPPSDHPDSHRFGFDTGRILDEYQLHLITRGSGLFESEDLPRFEIEAGTVFLLFPGIWHRYRPQPETGWDEYWIGFNGEQAQRIMSEPFFSCDQPVIAVGDEPRLLDHLTDVAATIEEDRPGAQRVLAGLAMLVLGSVQQRASYGSDPRADLDHVLSQAKQRIAGNLLDTVDGKALAAELDVNYHWLRRIFRKHTGYSLNQYQLQLRLARAMDLLEGSEREVQDVALEVGFADPYYFSRVFSKEIGLSPQRWRARRRGLDHARP